EMRAAAEQAFADEPRFHSRGARAEATELPDQGAALVAAAQAFHWFDPEQCRREWGRILMPGGVVAVVWNQRRLGSSFMLSYEAVMQRVAEFGEVSRWQRDNEAVTALFGAGTFETLEYPNQQTLDWEGLRGRMLSSSYVPKPGAPGHNELMLALRRAY